MSFRLLPQAEADIAEISVYIAYDSKAAAHSWVETIFAQCGRLADMPELGVARDEIRPGLRMMPTGNYLILYRKSVGDIEIVRVLDSRRKWQDLL